MFLPDGRRFLLFVRSSQPNKSGIYLCSLDRPQEKTLVVQSMSGGAYAPPHGKRPGHLLWLRESNLMAQPFAPERAQLSGEPAIISGGEAVGSIAALNMASFSVSNEGTVLFAGAADRYDLAWFSRDGKVSSTLGNPDRYVALRISPDGSRVAVSIVDASGNRDLWGMEVARGLPSRLTSDGGGFVSVWSPDGDRIAYHSSSQNRIFTLGPGSDRQTLLESPDLNYINDWSPDGRFVMFTRTSAATLHDLWLLPIAGERTPEPFLKTPYSESHGQFSPDGKWIAYTSNESGRSEIYVQSLPASVSKPVSSNGGGFPRWRKDGKELFYRGADGQLMAVSVRARSDGIGVWRSDRPVPNRGTARRLCLSVRCRAGRTKDPGAQTEWRRAGHPSVDGPCQLGSWSEKVT